jgi:hypothetical protein
MEPAPHLLEPEPEPEYMSGAMACVTCNLADVATQEVRCDITRIPCRVYEGKNDTGMMCQIVIQKATADGDRNGPSTFAISVCPPGDHESYLPSCMKGRYGSPDETHIPFANEKWFSSNRDEFPLKGILVDNRSPNRTVYGSYTVGDSGEQMDPTEDSGKQLRITMNRAKRDNNLIALRFHKQTAYEGVIHKVILKIGVNEAFDGLITSFIAGTMHERLANIYGEQKILAQRAERAADNLARLQATGMAADEAVKMIDKCKVVIKEAKETIARSNQSVIDGIAELRGLDDRMRAYISELHAARDGYIRAETQRRRWERTAGSQQHWWEVAGLPEFTIEIIAQMEQLGEIVRKTWCGQEGHLLTDREMTTRDHQNAYRVSFQEGYDNGMGAGPGTPAHTVEVVGWRKLRTCGCKCRLYSHQYTEEEYGHNVVGESERLALRKRRLEDMKQTRSRSLLALLTSNEATPQSAAASLIPDEVILAVSGYLGLKLEPASEEPYDESKYFDVLIEDIGGEILKASHSHVVPEPDRILDVMQATYTHFIKAIMHFDLDWFKDKNEARTRVYQYVMARNIIKSAVRTCYADYLDTTKDLIARLQICSGNQGSKESREMVAHLTKQIESREKAIANRLLRDNHYITPPVIRPHPSGLGRDVLMNIQKAINMTIRYELCRLVKTELIEIVGQIKVDSPRGLPSLFMALSRNHDQWGGTLFKCLSIGVDPLLDQRDPMIEEILGRRPQDYVMGEQVHDAIKKLLACFNKRWSNLAINVKGYNHTIDTIDAVGDNIADAKETGIIDEQMKALTGALAEHAAIVAANQPPAAQNYLLPLCEITCITSQMALLQHRFRNSCDASLQPRQPGSRAGHEVAQPRIEVVAQPEPVEPEPVAESEPVAEPEPAAAPLYTHEYLAANDDEYAAAEAEDLRSQAASAEAAIVATESPQASPTPSLEEIRRRRLLQLEPQ